MVVSMGSVDEAGGVGAQVGGGQVLITLSAATIAGADLGDIAI
jgi:hypothetical protein